MNCRTIYQLRTRTHYELYEKQKFFFAVYTVFGDICAVSDIINFILKVLDRVHKARLLRTIMASLLRPREIPMLIPKGIFLIDILHATERLVSHVLINGVHCKLHFGN